MTNRTVSTLLLFFAGALTTAVALALVMFITSRAGYSMGPWTLPVVALLSFVPIFFMGRRRVLPPAYSAPPLRALAIITGWMACTMLAAVAIAWVIRPLEIAIGFGPSAVTIWLGCVLVTLALLDRYSAKLGA